MAEPTSTLDAKEERKRLLAELEDLERRSAAIRRELSDGRRGQRIAYSEWPTIIARLSNGETMEAVATEYGVTRQRVDQIVAEVDPTVRERGPRMRRAIRMEQRAVEADVTMVRTAIRNGPCLVCFGPVTRSGCGGGRTPGRLTCSPRCAKLWGHCRYQLDDECRRKHLLATARSVLKSDRTTPIERRHAERVLVGTAGTHGRWVNSAAMEARLAEVERLRRATQDSGETWWR